ncbi:MAG TPA: DUF1674 domain-containing protein [Steroidobacteraceae bacterium]
MNIGPIWQTRRLIMQPTQDVQPVTNPTPVAPESAAASAAPPRPLQPTLPREIGGRDGPDPTRYGDWEKAGRCIDF